MSVKELSQKIDDILNNELRSSNIKPNLHKVASDIKHELWKEEIQEIAAEKRMDGWLGRIVRNKYSLAIVAGVLISVIGITAAITYALCEFL